MQSIVFLIVLIFFPYIFVSIVLGAVLGAILIKFRIRFLALAASIGSLTVLTWMNRTPNPNQEFESLVEMISTMNPAGIPTYVWLFTTTILFLAASYRGQPAETT